MNKRVKTFLRPVVQQILSPTAVQFLRSQSWYVSSYVPRLVSSRVSERTPDVRFYGVSVVPSLKHLKSLNLDALSDLPAARSPDEEQHALAQGLKQLVRHIELRLLDNEIRN